jgi:hypothetical protein
MMMRVAAASCRLPFAARDWRRSASVPRNSMLPHKAMLLCKLMSNNYTYPQLPMLLLLLLLPFMIMMMVIL